MWSAYRGRPYPDRTDSIKELDRRLGTQASPMVPPSIRAVTAARALRTRPPGPRRLPRS
ncbi:hypothetical protein [Streptosporangium saharense]|uniref:hypothetical protein n=1 Tax=Streptosporangium saharense TaxID=1706840 RepID=UPI0036B8F059